MPAGVSFDEQLCLRLPLPLAQLYRRAHNAKSSLERHNAGYYFWEAGLKLLGATAVGVYLASGRSPDALLRERLQGLARPSVGHWWEIARSLTVELSTGDNSALAGGSRLNESTTTHHSPLTTLRDTGFASVHDLLLGRTRDDLPRLAGLDAALCDALDGSAGSRSTVRLTELFERLVRYRNREIGHGAAGQRPSAFYESMAQAFLTGLPQCFHGARDPNFARPRWRGYQRLLEPRRNASCQRQQGLDRQDLGRFCRAKHAQFERAHPRGDERMLEPRWETSCQRR